MNKKGLSLMEVMLVVALVAVVVIAVVKFFSGSTPFVHRIQVRQDVMTTSRAAIDTIVERLRNGKARTVIISTPATAPIVPNSQIDFALQTPLPSGATAYEIYLGANNIAYTVEFPPGNAPNVLAKNVTSLIFTGGYQDAGVVGVTLQMNEPWDNSGDITHSSIIVLPNQTVHMVESQ